MVNRGANPREGQRGRGGSKDRKKKPRGNCERDKELAGLKGGSRLANFGGGVKSKSDKKHANGTQARNQEKRMNRRRVQNSPRQCEIRSKQ